MLTKILPEYYYQHHDYFSKCIKNNINHFMAIYGYKVTLLKCGETKLSGSLQGGLPSLQEKGSRTPPAGGRFHSGV